MDPLLAGGLETSEEAARIIGNVLTEPNPYVPLSRDGRLWLESNREIVESLLIAEAEKALTAG